MLKVALLSLALLISLSACSEKAADTAEAAAAECIEPSNPFNDDGGHDAGFKWSEENGGECSDSHGESFEEGCQEYQRQLEAYERCQAEKRR
jgi:hypothetical protein